MARSHTPKRPATPGTPRRPAARKTAKALAKAVARPTASAPGATARRARAPRSVLRARQPDSNGSAAAGPVGEAQAPAMRIDDLTAQGEPESRAGRFCGVERQQRVAHHFLGQPAATI